MYTISANLIDKGHGVDNFSPLGDTSWSSAEERKKVTGWRGDCTHVGDDGVSFGLDDYKADLDSDNIAHRYKEEDGLLSVMNDYYKDIKVRGNDDDGLSMNKVKMDNRAEEFLGNHDIDSLFKDANSEIGMRFGNNGDGKLDYKDLEKYKHGKYYEAYLFFKRLADSQNN
jgi:hypothetical protein